MTVRFRDRGQYPRGPPYYTELSKNVFVSLACFLTVANRRLMGIR
jgi:hypothetical protein